MTLADIVRDKVERGVLPRHNPGGSVGTVGSGQPCSACDLTIARTDTELAFELPNQDVLRFHFACCAVWLTTLSQLRE